MHGAFVGLLLGVVQNSKAYCAFKDKGFGLIRCQQHAVVWCLFCIFLLYVFFFKISWITVFMFCTSALSSLLMNLWSVVKKFKVYHEYFLFSKLNHNNLLVFCLVEVMLRDCAFGKNKWSFGLHVFFFNKSLVWTEEDNCDGISGSKSDSTWFHRFLIGPWVVNFAPDSTW